MNIELYKMIPLDKPFPYTHMLQRVVAYTIYIPTEIVINKPQIVAPIQVARVFDSGLFLTDADEQLTYDELVQRQIKKTGGFEGTRTSNPIYLVEIWADYGSDGHTEYKFFGWRFVPKSVLNEDIKEYEAHPYNGEGLPECMSDNCDEWYMQKVADKAKKLS